MAIVTVYPSDMPPVKFEGRVWVRTGPRRSIASAQEERILNEKRRYKSIPFDICPIPTAKISNLSKSIFENEYLPNAFSDYDPEQDERSYAENSLLAK
jgi:ATP-dependent DNA helicase RecG